MLPLQSSKENVICINNLGIWEGSTLRGLPDLYNHI